MSKASDTRDGTSTLNELVNQFFDSTTVHGYGHAYRQSGWKRRVLWLAASVGLTIWAVTQISDVVSDYSKHPKKFTSSEVEDPKVEFPGVTVCSLNPLPRSSDLDTDPTWHSFVTLEQMFSQPDCDHDERSYSKDDAGEGRGEVRRKRQNILSGRKASGERDWNLTSCQPGYKPCDDWCLPSSVFCNGFGDCLSEVDEWDCEECQEDAYECKNGVCIRSSFLCNGKKDCPDGEDEENCPSDCPEGYFTCSSGTCIHPKLRCDSVIHCPNQTDEHNCDECQPGSVLCNGNCVLLLLACELPLSCSQTDDQPNCVRAECQDDAFQCPDGFCIPASRRCDGRQDCNGFHKEDRVNDESKCTECKNDAFLCKSGKCITSSEVCDGYVDCPGREDEMNCTQCKHNNFLCQAGNCIPGKFVCDNYTDCAHGEDEAVCYQKVCPQGYFQCRNQFCITDVFRCDGEIDCQDGEDEQNCLECYSGSYQCRDQRCIRPHQLCNGVPECSEGEDEVQCSSTKPERPAESKYRECKDGLHYNPRFQCDTVKQCSGGEDEKDCHLTDLDLTDAVHGIRINCSSTYRNLVYLLHGNVSSSDKLSSCSDDFYRESVFFSPICQIGVICDYFGCYDKNLKYYRPFAWLGLVCATCGDGENRCWWNKWLIEWQEGKLSQMSLKVMLEVQDTGSFADISELYVPKLDDRQKFAIPAEEVMYYCHFDERPCNHEDFYTWLSDHYGTCYTFTSPFSRESELHTSPKRVTHSGLKYGLHLTLNIKSGLSVLSPEVGVRVIIHNPHQLPIPEEEGFNIGPGSSSIGVSRTLYKRLGHPHGDCREDFSMETPLQYSRLLCKQLCLEAAVREQCSCYVGLNPIYNTLHNKPDLRCNPLNTSQRLCMDVAQEEINRDATTCDCPVACWETKFYSEVTTSRVNDQYYTLLHKLRKKVTSLCFNDTEMINLNVFLSSMFHELIEETPAYTWETLLSNIGGSLGLFIGVSVVTVLEVVELLWDLARIGVTGGGRSKQPCVHPDQPSPLHQKALQVSVLEAPVSCRNCLSLREEVEELKKEQKVMKEVMKAEKQGATTTTTVNPEVFRLWVYESVKDMFAVRETTTKNSC